MPPNTTMVKKSIPKTVPILLAPPGVFVYVGTNIRLRNLKNKGFYKKNLLFLK